MDYIRKVQNNIISVSDSNREILSIREEADDTAMSFYVKGELLNEIVYELEDELIAGMSVRDILRIDLTELTYLASSGLRSLLKIQNMIDERKKGELIILNASSQVIDIFEKNGFLDLFDFR